MDSNTRRNTKMAKQINYEGMVMGLAKSGLIMRGEWTNEEKEILYLFNEMFNIGSSLNEYAISKWPPMHNAKSYELNHMTFALLIEIGELADPFKKKLIYRKEYNDEANKNIKEEIGDILFYITFIHVFMNENGITKASALCETFLSYLTSICELLKTSIAECKQMNYDKLSTRYEGLKYSNEKAIERKDKDNE